MSMLAKLHQYLLKIETGLLVLFLLSLILIAVIQILLRNLLGGGLLWVDSYTRICVLWLAMLGAMVGSRQQTHLAIDVLVRFLPAAWKNLSQRLCHAMTSAVCMAAAWFSSDFLMQEYTYAEKAFAEIPNWLCESIIPLAFAVMALRYAVAACLPQIHRS